MKKIYMFMLFCLSFIFSGSMFAEKAVDATDSTIKVQKVGGGDLDLDDKDDKDEMDDKDDKDDKDDMDDKDDKDDKDDNEDKSDV